MNQERSPFCFARCARTACVVVGIGLCFITLVGSLGARGTVEARAEVGLQRPHVVVLKAKRVMHLFEGDVLVRTYPIDLGTSPVGQKLLKGDGRTPEGVFRVVTKMASNRHRRFLGLDYPNSEAVARGLESGLISEGEAANIRLALADGRCPEWNTGLGGGIGIHGGARDEDWTAGCIALSDRHIDELFSVLRIGDTVEILP